MSRAVIGVSLNPEEKKKIELEAKKRHMRVSTFIKSFVLTGLDRQRETETENGKD